MTGQLRLATSADIPELRSLIAASVRGLQAQDSSPAQMEAALRTVFTVDSQLIADGTYFVVAQHGVLAGCGGWSKRKTLFGGDHHAVREDALLDPLHDAAKIRAIFVHPDWARRGIGSLILEAAENAAVAAGFTHFEMGATLTGVPLYRLKGYVEVDRFDVLLGDGISMPVVRMVKNVEG
ncbi:MAG TPA: GNAT family N-acetyltransferase [Acidobacteriaceae bacterium]|jgi:GNAT superfamily N-acetyltransferase|nr:GNAT family N-acetyltransferase [Acidobacteriaceae bacterium]